MCRARSGQAIEWVDPQVKKYLTREWQFLQKLLVAMHITRGQLVRGLEIGYIKTQNSIYSAWSIYVINGLICFLITYDKA